MAPETAMRPSLSNIVEDVLRKELAKDAQTSGWNRRRRRQTGDLHLTDRQVRQPTICVYNVKRKIFRYFTQQRTRLSSSKYFASARKPSPTDTCDTGTTSACSTTLQDSSTRTGTKPMKTVLSFRRFCLRMTRLILDAFNLREIDSVGIVRRAASAE